MVQTRTEIHQTQVDHPLCRLTADEIGAARAVMDAAGLVDPSTKFALVSLEEPPKSEVLAHTAGAPIDRRVRAVLLDVATGKSRTVVVSVTRAAVDTVEEIDPATQGQPPILLEEFIAVDEIVKADERWQEAMKRRGISDFDLVATCPLSAGSFGIAGEEGRRMLRVLSFRQHRRADHPWAHPIDGVVAYVDLTERSVIDLIEEEPVAIPAEEGNFDDPATTGPQRTDLRPIEITQPEGVSFSLDGDVISWQGWSIRVGFDVREGLTLHQISINDRPVVYRASIAEMVVPYAHPGQVRYWQNYFDAGEYLLGAQANSLLLGCDCLGAIQYLDAVVADGDGNPREITNAICMHEEDFGVLWKHTDIFTEAAETRRQRRFVISYFATVGNYDYGFYWYFYLDGTIECEVKATGVLFTSAYPADGDPWASQVAPGLGGPYHQHLFGARLDMLVDGVENSVDEVDVVAAAPGPDNPHGNAFGARITRLERESEAARLADPAAARTWRVVNPGRLNRMGAPVGYALHPQGLPTLLADERASITDRARFATKHLWVTRYDPAERYPAGDLVNQHPGGAGLPAYVAADRPIDGADIVLWHTFGMTHLPRPEDWPVMPVDRCGFTLKPYGFFDRNPTLDVPASPSGGSCHAS